MSNYKILVKDVRYNSNGTVSIEGVKLGTKQSINITCSAEQLCTSTLKPNNSTNKTSTQKTLFKLTDIPSAMRAKGWHNAAYLNEQWLNGENIEMTNADKGRWAESNKKLNYYNPSKFNHQWLSGFKRYKDGIEHLKNNVITTNSKPVIIESLNLNNAFSHSNLPKLKTTVYGSSNYKSIANGNDCQVLHRDWQIQFKKINASNFSKGVTFVAELGIDDLWATFGSFAVYAAIGDYSITALSDELLQITIKSIVCYMVDSYDFMSVPDDYLGHWNKNDFEFNIVFKNSVNNLPNYANPRTGQVLTSVDPDDLLFPVFNHHYQQYRKKYNKGRDMTVWSKPHKINISHMEEGYHTFRVGKSEISKIIKRT